MLSLWDSRLTNKNIAQIIRGYYTVHWDRGMPDQGNSIEEGCTSLNTAGATGLLRHKGEAAGIGIIIRGVKVDAADRAGPWEPS